MGNIAFCNADYQNALKYYQEMHKLNPRSYIAMINMANTYYALEKYVLALDFAKKCRAYTPNVALSVVDVIGDEEVANCQKIADKLNIPLRVRKYSG